MERQPIDINVFRKWVETWFINNNIMDIAFGKQWRTPRILEDIQKFIRENAHIELKLIDNNIDIENNTLVVKLLSLSDKDLVSVMFHILLRWKNKCRYWNNRKNKGTLPFFVFVLESELKVKYQDSQYYYKKT